MIFLRQKIREWLWLAGAALKWLALIIPMAMLVGSACAFFLWSLEYVTNVRFGHPWLLYFLPLGGVGVGLL